MARPTISPRELHVQAPELIPQLDLVARYMGETRSVTARVVMRRGIAAILSDLGLTSVDELVEYLVKKGA